MVEKGEKRNGESRSDQRIAQESQGEKRRGMFQQNTLRDGEHRLVKMKKQEYEDEAGDGMFGIDPRADG